MKKPKALKDLTKEELLSFIYNHPPGDVNIFHDLAICMVCGEVEAKYSYECLECQGEDESSNKGHFA